MSPGPGATGLVVLVVLVLGAPQVWVDVASGALGLESVFFPVLAVALSYVAVSRRSLR